MKNLAAKLRTLEEKLAIEFPPTLQRLLVKFIVDNFKTDAEPDASFHMAVEEPDVSAPMIVEEPDISASMTFEEPVTIVNINMRERRWTRQSTMILMAIFSVAIGIIFSQ